MFDDLRRNFLMNPQTGLKIRPFKNAPTEGHKDKELKRLTRYLKAIADLDDFTQLDHRNWESVSFSNKFEKVKQNPFKWLRARKQSRSKETE